MRDAAVNPAGGAPITPDPRLGIPGAGLVDICCGRESPLDEDGAPLDGPLRADASMAAKSSSIEERMDIVQTCWTGIVLPRLAMQCDERQWLIVCCVLCGNW